MIACITDQSGARVFQIVKVSVFQIDKDYE